MAAEARIKLVVDNTQARKAVKEVDKDVQGVQSSASALKGALVGAFSAVAIGATVKQFVTLADAFTTLQNRLKTVTGSEAELGAVTEEITAIANKTRSSLEATAEVYSRVALSAKDLGVSQREVLSFTESLNQAVALSGATGAEAQAGMIQLSQGLASGALRGDELRSVLEQLPVVADVISKSLGVTRGELRQMGAEGKITADVVMKAFRDSREELADRFAKSVPTVSQAFALLRNNLVASVGDFNKTTGATAGLASALVKLSEVLPTIGRFLTSMFQTPIAGLLALVETVKQLPELFKALSEALFNAIVGAIERGINKLIDGLNKIRGFFKQPLVDHIELFRSDLAEMSVEEAARNLGATFKKTFEAAITPDERAFVDLTKKSKSADELFVERFGNVPLVKDVTGPKFETPEAGAALTGIEQINKQLIQTPDLVGNIVETINPLFDVMATGFAAAEDQLVQFVTTGKLSMKDLVDSVLESLTRLLFRKGIASLLKSLGGSDLAAQLLPGYQHGGSFKVGGSGGTDSQVVAFRATPGENVTVGQPTQPVSVAAPDVRVRVVNQLDPHLALDALSTQAGERVVMNIIQRNPTTIRRVLGG